MSDRERVRLVLNESKAQQQRQTLGLSTEYIDESATRARSDSLPPFPLPPPPPSAASVQQDSMRRIRSLTQRLPATPRTPKNIAASSVMLRLFDNIDSDSNKTHSQTPPSSTDEESEDDDDDSVRAPTPSPKAADWRNGLPIETAMYKPMANLPDEHIHAELKKRAEGKLIKEKELQQRRGSQPDDDDDSSGTSDIDNEELRTLIPSAESPRRARLEAAMQHRQQTTIMSRYIQATNCGYSFTELYGCVSSGLSETLSEQFWVTQCIDAAAPRLPEFDKLIDTALLPRAVFNQIMLDIYRTEVVDMPQDFYFLNNLYRGVVVHAALRPDIGYVQGMNILWSHVISCVSRPQHQLIVAEHLVNHVLPYYFTTDLLGARVDAIVLKHFLVRRCEKLEALMRGYWDDLDLMMLKLTASSFTTLFVDRLRARPRRLLWDLIMFRGAVVLIEFSLQLMIYGYTMGWIDQESGWPHFITRIEQALPKMETLDEILSIQVPNGHIVLEDFTTRRRAATRSVLSELGVTGK